MDPWNSLERQEELKDRSAFLSTTYPEVPAMPAYDLVGNPKPQASSGHTFVVQKAF